MNPTEAVIDSFERCAAADIDITDAVYRSFFADDAKAVALMGHSDEQMRGSMLSEVLTLLMSEATEESKKYLRWEVDNHLLAYGVRLDMYDGFLAAVKASVKAALQDDWNSAHEQGWEAKITELRTEIDTMAAALQDSHPH